MTSKTSWHIIGDPSPAFDDIQHSGVKVVKVMDYESRETLTALKQIVPFVVYRKYTSANYDSISPQSFADSLPVKVMGIGLVFEGINEPVISTPQQAQQLSAWYVEYANIMHSRGEQVAAYSFSTGNPLLNLVPYLADGAAACDYLALHEYVHPTDAMFDQIGRYRDFLNQLPINSRKQVLITETGCDSGGCKECGWSGPNWKLKPQQYLDVLAKIDSLYVNDDSLIAATIFSYGGGWTSFEIHSISKQLSQQIRNAGGGIIPPKPQPQPPVTPPVTPSVYVKGIDVSHWQGVMDWSKAKANGAQFAFIKATDGVSTIDSQFATNQANAKAAGLYRGFYHYFRNALDPRVQAQVFVDACHGDYGELPLALDFEDTTADPDLAGIKIFLEQVHTLSHHPCLIYTGTWYWKLGYSVDWAKQYDLWVAYYSGQKPTIPSDWNDWTFWQYSATGDGKAYGAQSNAIDLDRFHGSLTELQQYVEQTVATPQTGALELSWNSANIQELYLDGKGIVGSGTQTFPVTTDAEHTFKVVARKP